MAVYVPPRFLHGAKNGFVPRKNVVQLMAGAGKTSDSLKRSEEENVTEIQSEIQTGQLCPDLLELD